VQVSLTTKIRKNRSQLQQLVKDDEEARDVASLPPQDILVRWINFHLKKAEHDQTVRALTPDLKARTPSRPRVHRDPMWVVGELWVSLLGFGVDRCANEQDSVALTLLLWSLAPRRCDKKALDTEDLTRRARLVLDNAGKLDCPKVATHTAIAAGHSRMTFSLVAHIFCRE
jgi:plastin-1